MDNIMQNRFKVNIPLAIIITLISVLYQRATGPTYPQKFYLPSELGEVKVKLLRSHGGESDAPVQLPVLGKDPVATLTYKRWPTNDDWTTVTMQLKDNQLVAALPVQPPAGKHQYFVNYTYDGVNHTLGTEKEPITIRFKGDVPIFILAPHIFFMFLSMLIASLAALEAWSKTETYPLLAKTAFSSLFIGGMVLGPMVQKYAFGVFWAGIPFGWDLTDNKLLIGVVSWFIAAALNFKKPNRGAVITAAVILYAIYSIPHSTMGSQLNYDSGKVETLKELKGP